MASKRSLFLVTLATIAISGALTEVKGYSSSYCGIGSRCEHQTLYCPSECPSSESNDPDAKFVASTAILQNAKPNANRISGSVSLLVSHRKPNCNSPGSACYDPRFIGGDGIVFYFHGKVNEHFALISDSNLQINGRFIGHRPAGRSRDFTWIQSLGLLFNSHTFSLEATKSATWDREIDHLKFAYDGEEISLPGGGFLRGSHVRKK
ncbi:hypothetical protein HanRHA438_Chr11g0491041 [Helianthus annuus]|nr:hypothetical protein HanRHA438_Chr11g0491041 [Helianthus annuus]